MSLTHNDTHITAHVPPHLVDVLRSHVNGVNTTVKRKVQDTNAQENEKNQKGAKGIKCINDNLMFLLPEIGERICMYYYSHVVLGTRLQKQDCFSPFKVILEKVMCQCVSSGIKTCSTILKKPVDS